MIDLPVMVAYLMGLKFQIEDKTCKDEVKNVKNNILITKVVQVINVVIVLICMILSGIG